MNEYRPLTAEERQTFAPVLAHFPDLRSVSRFIDTKLDKVYDVFLLDGSIVLKKGGRDKEKYDLYFAGKSFAVPAILSSFRLGEDTWITMPYLNGSDARGCDETTAARIGAALARIQRHYLAPAGHTPEADRYFARYGKRFFDKMRPLFPAYGAVFDEVQEQFFSAPHSLIHDDLLPINVLLTGEQVWFLDWEMAGVCPYFLDLARFAFVRNESGALHIPPASAQAFLDAYYAGMREDPDFRVEKSRFLRDVACAALLQYSMFCYYEQEAHREEVRRILAHLQGR